MFPRPAAWLGDAGALKDSWNVPSAISRDTLWGRGAMPGLCPLSQVPLLAVSLWPSQGPAPDAGFVAGILDVGHQSLGGSGELGSAAETQPEMTCA